MGKQNKAITTHRFSHGDRVFAKMKGYPFWPARIEQLPNETNGLKDKYEVLFYGTYQTITLKAEFLVSYNEETKQQYGQKRKQKSFNEALHEIEFDPNLEQKNDDSEKQIEEINEEISETQSSQEEEEEEEIDTESNETKSVKSTDEVKTIKQKNDIEPSRRSSRRAPKTESNESQQQTKILKEQQNESTSSSSTSSSKKLAGKRRSEHSSRLASNQSETASIKSDELENSAFSNSPPPPTLLPPTITTTLTEQEEPVNTINLRRQSSRPSKPNKRYSNNADQEEISNQPSAKIKRKVSTNIDEKSTNSSKKIIKAKRQRSNSQLSSVSYTSSKSDSNKTNDNFDNDQNNSVNSSIDNTMIVEPTLVENETISKSIESENKSQTENTDKELEKKINFKNSLKEKKKKEKKLAFILSIRIEIALERMDREIKKSLRVDKTDVNRCCLIMQDLIKLPFSRKHMLKSPAIIETIRKCRKFKDSETVRNLSNEFFNKLYNIFTVSSEAFKDVFDKEKSKYLNENEKEIKKERIWKEKCLNEDKRLSSGGGGGAKRLITSNNNRKHSKSFNLDRKDSTELFFSSVPKQSFNNIDTTNECFDSEAQD